jgi:hypothetical protein
MKRPLNARNEQCKLLVMNPGEITTMTWYQNITHRLSENKCRLNAMVSNDYSWRFDRRFIVFKRLQFNNNMARARKLSGTALRDSGIADMCDTGTVTASNVWKCR